MRHTTGRELARIVGDWRSQHEGIAGYAQLANAIRSLVLDGRLSLHVRLPSERDLASALGVSRTTATAAYEALRASGYAASKRGAGTWTAIPDSLGISNDSVSWAPFANFTGSQANFTQASPIAPAQALREAYEAALAALPRYLGDSGYFLLGIPEAREAVAERFTQRGLPTSPGQIMITAGAQHALSLITASHLSAGDRVLLEHPTYPNTLENVRLSGARPVPVALTDEGWDVDAVAAALRQTAPRLAVLIPDFQNPTGLLATTRERADLAEKLTQTRTPTVIDESLAELNLDEPDMPPPFATFAGNDLTLTIGSLHKCVWGGMRVGWIRAEPATIRRLALVRAANDLSSAALEQLAVAHMLPRLDNILDDRRKQLRHQRDVLLDALAARLPSWRIRKPSGGLVLWADLGAPISTALVGAAAQHGIALASGTRFGVDGAFEQRIRLPYTASPDGLIDAVDQIAAAFHSITPTPGTRSRTNVLLT
jgi:DNA-binding transcriptional MocR family regulator